jgi:opacity protein-like surface antigen
MRTIFCLLLASLPLFSFSQKKIKVDEINFLIGKNTTKFLYAFGSETKPTQWINDNSYSLNVNFALAPKHFLRPEVNYYQAGAKSNVDNLALAWRLNYLGLGCGYAYKALSLKTISVSTGVSFGLDFMTKGEQTIGNERYSITESDILKRLNVGTSLFANAQIKVTEALYLQFEYRFGIGLNQIEKDVGEKTRNISNTALIGLSFKL